ncbi:MAG: ABC transporter permease [Burkholderiaceae bacterium]|jgi:putative spermidine/putrescine transport system permease protein
MAAERIAAPDSTWLALPATLLIAAFVAVPCLGLLLLSLSTGFRPGDGWETLISGPMGLDHYRRLLGDGFVLGRLARTLAISAAVTAVTLAMGIPLALACWQTRGPIRNLLVYASVMPLLISVVVSAYGWSVLLGRKGLVNEGLAALGLISQPLKLMHSDLGIVIGLTHILLPFMVLSILASLERIPRALLEAASTLGANRWRTHLLITLPLARAGLRSGVLLVFTLAMCAFVTPAVLGGNGTPVFPMVIYEQFSASFQWAYGAALSIMLLVVMVLLVTVFMALSASRRPA